MHNDLGFTLIELLIVIAVIGILAGILLPNILHTRDKANETAAAIIGRNILAGMAQTEVNTSEAAKCHYQDGVTIISTDVASEKVNSGFPIEMTDCNSTSSEWIAHISYSSNGSIITKDFIARKSE